MFHIPTSRSAVQEQVTQGIISDAKMNTDGDFHLALKEGGLGSLSGEVGAGFLHGDIYESCIYSYVGNGGTDFSSW